MTASSAAAPTKDVRGAILAEATRLFREHGVDGFSMRQIADAIGYSATTIYLHFKDKNHLMYAVCESGFAQFGASLASAGASEADPRERLRAIGRAYVDFALTHPLHYEVMFIRPKEWAIGPMTDDRMGTDRSDPESFAGLVLAVQAAVDAGVFAGTLHEGASAREVAMRFWAASHGVVALAISMNDQIEGFDDAAVRARGEAAIDAALGATM
jgi:AcrR family transcriptional regulator